MGANMRSPPRSGRTGLAKVALSSARSAGSPPTPPSKMYLAELRPGAKLVIPSSSLMPSRKQVLPLPLGPVATLIPSTSSGIGSGRSDPQWTSWTSSILGIAAPDPPGPPQLRGPPPQVGQPLVAADQRPGRLGRLRLVERVEQGAGLDPSLAQGQVAGTIQMLERAGQAGAVEPGAEQLGQVVEVQPRLAGRLPGPGALLRQEAEVQPAGGEHGQLVGAEGDHRLQARRSGQGAVQPRQPALRPGRVGELAARPPKPPAHLLAGLLLAQLRHVGGGHRPDQQHAAQLGGVHEARSSPPAQARAGVRGASASPSPGSPDRSPGARGARTPVQETMPTSSWPTTSKRGCGSRSAARLPSPAGPQRDQASTAAAMRAVASAQVPPTTHLARSVSPRPASQVITSAASRTKSGTTSGDSMGSRTGSGSGTTTGSGRPRCSSRAAKAVPARPPGTAGRSWVRPATSPASDAGSVAATTARRSSLVSALAPSRESASAWYPPARWASVTSSTRACNRPVTVVARWRSASWSGPTRSASSASAAMSARWTAASPAAACRASSAPSPILLTRLAWSRSRTAQTAATSCPSSDNRQASARSGRRLPRGSSASTSSPSARSSPSSLTAVAGSSQVRARSASASRQLGVGSAASSRRTATLSRW